MRESAIHIQAAQHYEFTQDYISAREQYWKALVDAKLAKADPYTISMLTYNFARMTGYACHLDEAEKYLLESLELEKSVTGSDSGIFSKRLFELARLNYDQERYKDAAEFYARGIPIVERLGLDKSDPIALANALDEYADALSRIGNGVESEAIKQKSHALRQINPERKTDFVAVRYKCR